LFYFFFGLFFKNYYLIFFSKFRFSFSCFVFFCKYFVGAAAAAAAAVVAAAAGGAAGAAAFFFISSLMRCFD